MARERQYERLMEMDTCGVERWDYRDLSVTDVVVWEFDTEGDSSPAVGLVKGDAPPCVSTISADKRIKRIVHIKRQNDVEIVSADSSVVQVRDSVRVRENEQNKSSPDKTSSVAVIICFAAVLLVILFLAIFIYKLLH